MFQNCIFSLDFRGVKVSQTKLFENFIEQNGGQISFSISSSTNLLISTVQNIQDNSLKVQLATEKKILVLEKQYLEDCLNSNSKLDYSTYQYIDGQKIDQYETSVELQNRIEQCFVECLQNAKFLCSATNFNVPLLYHAKNIHQKKQILTESNIIVKKKSKNDDSQSRANNISSFQLEVQQQRETERLKEIEDKKRWEKENTEIFGIHKTYKELAEERRIEMEKKKVKREAKFKRELAQRKEEQKQERIKRELELQQENARREQEIENLKNDRKIFRQEENLFFEKLENFRIENKSKEELEREKLEKNRLNNINLIEEEKDSEDFFSLENYFENLKQEQEKLDQERENQEKLKKKKQKILENQLKQEEIQKEIDRKKDEKNQEILEKQLIIENKLKEKEKRKKKFEKKERKRIEFEKQEKLRKFQEYQERQKKKQERINNGEVIVQPKVYDKMKLFVSGKLFEDLNDYSKEKNLTVKEFNSLKQQRIKFYCELFSNYGKTKKKCFWEANHFFVIFESSQKSKEALSFFREYENKLDIYSDFVEKLKSEKKLEIIAPKPGQYYVRLPKKTKNSQP